LKVLPINSTVLDFAFEIHTDVGLRCIGAKVNQKIVPSSYKLSNGDQVEILTSKKQEPTEMWLDQVITAKAKARIKSVLKAHRQVIIDKGQKLADRYLRKKNVEINESNISKLIKFLNLNSPIDLYYSMGIGNLKLEEITGIKAYKGKLQTRKRAMNQNESLDQAIKNTLLKNASIIVFGENSDKIDYFLAGCCNPIPGDHVNGFINKNNDVEIHKANCPSSIKLVSKYGYKIVKTRWTKEHKIAFLTGLSMTGIDDVGVMHKITNVISGKLRINMQSITIDSHDGIFEGTIMVYVDDTKHLDSLMKSLQRLSGILSVSRLEETELSV